MTLLSDPAGTAPARPVSPVSPVSSVGPSAPVRSGSPVRPVGATSTSPRRAVAPASPLARAVAAAVASLDDVDGSVPLEVRRRIDAMLRLAVDRHLARVGEDGPVAAVPALRVACAHLAAGDLEDAYLALLTARDLLR